MEIPKYNGLIPAFVLAAQNAATNPNIKIRLAIRI